MWDFKIPNPAEKLQDFLKDLSFQSGIYQKNRENFNEDETTLEQHKNKTVFNQIQLYSHCPISQINCFIGLQLCIIRITVEINAPFPDCVS